MNGKDGGNNATSSGLKTIIQLDESASYFNNLMAYSSPAAGLPANSSGLFSSFIINNLHALTPNQVSSYAAATAAAAAAAAAGGASNGPQILPYHYSEYEHIFVCNLCNCTYDSLRSIKAHLWKHSGHHELSYPIHNMNNNSRCKYIMK
jgi:hypothetical protein